ncbi:MAG: HypC/HybG/HupF family hydrogenase formation chaperone [Desulfurococcaceae archaeon]
MCLGVPARVLDVESKGSLSIVKVSIGGIVKEVINASSEPIAPGDYVIVHAGMAISKIDEEELEAIFKIWEEVEKVIEAS